MARLTAVLSLLISTAAAQKLPSLREQADIRERWIEERVNGILPALLMEHGVRHWILSQREYGEDTVWRSLANPLSVNARRRTVMVYSLNETLNGVDTTELVSFEASIWDDLRATVSPKGLIAVNIDANMSRPSFSDGLSAGEFEAMAAGLGEETMTRVVRRPGLAEDFIAIRPPSMLPYYQRLMGIAHQIIAEALSNRAITPGTTTCADVQWWMHERIASFGLTAGFHPSFGLQRRGTDNEIMLDGDTVIQRGDLLWMDIGIIGMGNLWTDTQRVGYVLLPGETAPPPGILRGLATSNAAQDAMMRQLMPGRSGNEVLRAVVADTEAAGIDALFYSHPVGDHMHGAGATIGLHERNNENIAIRGDVKVRANTWYSVELKVALAVPEWGDQVVSFRQEEDAVVDSNEDTQWILNRQEEYYLVV